MLSMVFRKNVGIDEWICREGDEMNVLTTRMGPGRKRQNKLDTAAFMN